MPNPDTQDPQLKHYDDYKARLINFALAHEIEVRFVPGGEDAWLPAKRIIRIDEEQSDVDKIASLLHELGHAIDELTNINEKKIAELEDAYKVVYTAKRISSKRKRTVLSHERKAWKIGRAIAKVLKIRLGKWYTDIEHRCLEAYK